MELEENGSNLFNNSNWRGRSRTEWTEEENKRFESALALYDETTANRWYKVAAWIPGKSIYDVMNQYMELAADVKSIEAGLFPLLRKRPRHQERKKGVPWTEDEHRRFLMGLEKHGKGDWRNISRNFVISKTPTQVASHAQKYFQRQLSASGSKRRPSIHDITIHLSNDINPSAGFSLNRDHEEAAPAPVPNNNCNYDDLIASLLSHESLGTHNDSINANAYSESPTYHFWASSPQHL